MNQIVFAGSIGVLILLALLLVLEAYLLIQGIYSVPWVRTNASLSRRMLEAAGFKPGDRVLDLGSGDGSIVLEAVAMGGTGIGMERLWPLVLFSRLRAWGMGAGSKARFLKADILRDEFPDANIITCYLFTKVNARLEPRLRQRFAAGTLVISRDFTFPLLREVAFCKHKRSTIRVYEL